MRFSRAATRATDPVWLAALPAPPGLPAGLTGLPRVLEFISLDGMVFGCGSDQDVRRRVEAAQATARALDPQARIRCAASAETAARHLDLLTASGNNQWAICRRPGGADQVIQEEMGDLAAARLIATQPGRRRQRRPGPVDLVILVGQDLLYAPSVRRLRLLGIPTWLLVPGCLVAASLYACACAVSFLGPDCPDPTTGVQLSSRPGSLPLHSGTGS